MRRKRRCGLSVIPMCAGKWEKSTPTWHGKPVIKCPTEAEAVEYIMNRLESEVIQDDI